ncbi:4'-phosphopantetheinyl transferase [Mucilaginibacter pineti]|uniref:4'-phosphopantetheinyl transferase n=1 Tax=Mucilaginibacter pineti TaxID=1391627 RepID=A0A1G6TT02_9SPHI|nr:4'-phosphopantetheinyl transferase superfamily protein [Mucilaginibacter pineti]SDD32200.1 4'-phosphopantetheinyl transferase [Mucilaginibacter pineti]
MSKVEVSIQFLNAVEWHTRAACDFTLTSGVDVWRIDINANARYIDKLLTTLQPDEVARANRYLQERDRTRFIVSRASLRHIIGKYTNQPEAAITFTVGANKKPYVDGHSLKYNVSHSGNWVVIAVANSDIGADTETIDHTFPYQSILSDNFSDAEADFIGQSAEKFYLLWTRKEALTKATGQGLDDNLQHIPCLDGQQTADNRLLLTEKNWQVKSFNLDNKNIASVVAEADAAGMSFFEMGFM